MCNILGDGGASISGVVNVLYPAWSRWGMYHGCCSRRDGAQTSGSVGQAEHAIIPPSSVLEFIVHE